MLLGRIPRSRMGLMLGLTTFILLSMSAYQLDYITPSTRLGRALGLSPPDFGPINYTAAVVYLIQKSRMEDIPHSLSEAQRQIPWRSQWPIVLFHTGDYDTTEQRR